MIKKILRRLTKKKTHDSFKKVGENAFHMSKRIALTFIGSCIISVGLNAMIIPYGLLTGGVGGYAIIANMTVGLPVYAGILLINIPILIWGFWALSWKYMVQCMVGVLVMSGTLYLTQPFIPEPRLDIFVATIFSGILAGIGGGIILRSGSSGGGSDIIAVILRKKWNISVGSTSFYFNVAVMLIGFSFFDIRFIMYSIVSMYIAGKTANAIVEGLNKNKSVMIVSELHEKVADSILSNFGRGVTYLYGRGGYSKKDKNILICVVNNFELATVREIVHDIDPHAFFFVSDTFEVSGHGFKKTELP